MYAAFIQLVGALQLSIHLRVVNFLPFNSSKSNKKQDVGSRCNKLAISRGAECFAAVGFDEKIKLTVSTRTRRWSFCAGGELRLSLSTHIKLMCRAPADVWCAAVAVMRSRAPPPFLRLKNNRSAGIVPFLPRANRAAHSHTHATPAKEREVHPVAVGFELATRATNHNIIINMRGTAFALSCCCVIWTSVLLLLLAAGR